MAAPAGKYDITTDQGATFSRVITYKDSSGNLINLTGYTARMQVRATYNSPDILLSLTTENSRIALGGTAGTITLSVPSADMATLPYGTFVYDLELVSSSVVTRLVYGSFTNRVEVTR